VLSAARRKIGDIDAQVDRLTRQRCRLTNLLRAYESGDPDCTTLAAAGIGPDALDAEGARKPTTNPTTLHDREDTMADMTADTTTTIVSTLTDATFDEALRADARRLLLDFFWAPWCLHASWSSRCWPTSPASTAARCASPASTPTPTPPAPAATR
jgi:hypothetical protein